MGEMTEFIIEGSIFLSVLGVCLAPILFVAHKLDLQVSTRSTRRATPLAGWTAGENDFPGDD
jgi:hypothetical protein